MNSFFDETGLTHRAAQSVNDSVICIPLKYCITVKANNNNDDNSNNSINTTHKTQTARHEGPRSLMSIHFYL